MTFVISLCLWESFSYRVYVAEDSDLGQSLLQHKLCMNWLLHWASASLSPEFLVMHSSFNCLWCFFKFRYKFAVLCRDVVTIMRQALCSTFCWSASVVSNLKCSYTTAVLLLFGIKYPSIVSGLGEAVVYTPNFFPRLSSLPWPLLIGQPNL